MASQPAEPHEPHTDPAVAVAALLRRALPDVVDVAEIERLSGGASRETWRLNADGRALVMQLQRAGDSRDMLIESEVVRAAGSADVPVPELLAAGRLDSGAFMVVGAVGGETIARKIQRDDVFAAARPLFAAQCGAALARVHSIDPAAVVGLEHIDQIEGYTAVLDELAQPHPTFELARRWLLEHRPPPTELRVVHGDFRLGNLIVGPDGLRAVIDWELAHLGDPMEDLGWLCVKAWRFGGPGDVGGMGSREELFGAYEAAGGGPVDPETVRWWEVLGTWKWGIMCISQANAHRSGVVRSHELAAIGRRVCENEFDLLDPDGLDLFGLSTQIPRPGNSQPSSPGASPAGLADHRPHDVPSSIELLEAVREWIDVDVAADTGGRLRYHGRVASNMLAMVEREIRLGPAQSAAHRRRLAAFGVESDGELTASIRAGGFNDRVEELAAMLFDTVVDKLLVANPRYLGR